MLKQLQTADFSIFTFLCKQNAHGKAFLQETASTHSSIIFQALKKKHRNNAFLDSSL